MSPSSSKSKSKDKRAGKEQKASSRTSGTVNGTSGIPASAYNPVLGTFHTLDPLPTSALSSLQVNGRFRNIDETDDNSGSTNGSGADYDSASNNDTRSVESEELKEKALNAQARQEVIPGADNDKRDKIRQKNERKHQRQKERRAQELHERCSGYLMSRKLESLAQKLVAMGFSSERATVALINNEGKLEEAVAWLLEGGEESDDHKGQNLDTGDNLKIDISEELAWISDMETRFKCPKSEVERVIVACEGDLEKAEESLRAQKQDPPKSEEASDPASMSNGKISLAINQNSVRLQQQKPTSTIVIQQRKDEKELNYTKPATLVGPTPKIINKSVHQVTRVQSKLDWSRLQQQMTVPTEKRWPVGSPSSTSPSVSYSLASPLQVPPPPTKVESRHVSMTAGIEHKNPHPTLREPVVMMQRPQSINGKLMASVNPTNISSSPPGSAPGWYPSTSEMMKPNNGFLPYIPTTRSVSPNDFTLNHQLCQQQQHQFIPGTSPVDLQTANRAQALWKRVGSSPTLAVVSSLGLFSGLGSNCSSGSTSPVDWHTGGSMSSCDYNNIDWSLDRTFLPSMSKPANNGYWPKTSSLNIYDSSSATAGGVKQGSRPPSSNGGGPVHPDTASAEWTSPFEGKDLFSVPRQFVSSPSL